MTRRQVHRWTLWLLPLIAARAFLPIGFMLSVQADGLALTFCPGVMTAPLGSAADDPSDHEAHAHHHGGSDESSSSTVAETPCPFALVGFAPLAEVLQFEAALSAADVLLPDFTRLPPEAGPPRTDRARGPPDPFTATIV